MIDVIFDYKSDYKYEKGKYFNNYGCSPKILQRIMKYFDDNINEIESICISLYLFNNEILFNKLNELAIHGIEVNVISIPLEGYDDSKPKDIYEYETGELLYKDKTKYELAKNIYDKIKNETMSKLNLYVFPHIYVRSSKMNPFSRGRMPYSMHSKTFYVRMRGNKEAIGLTSSNLAVRDLVKNEVLVIGDGNSFAKEDYSAACQFYIDLIKSSKNIKEFDETHNYSNIMEMKNVLLSSNSYYIAPFYDDVQRTVRNRIKEIIDGAKKRIYICAEHICDYETYESEEYGFLKNVIQKARNGIDIRCLSQTFVDENGDNHDQRKPANIRNYKIFMKEYIKYPSCKYAVNGNVHSKYIIVDNTLILTTCNFTPTQFTYKKDINIERFEKIPGMSYHGTYSEVGCFIVINDATVCNEFVKSFDRIWQDKETYIHNNVSLLTKNDDERVCPWCNSPLELKAGRYGKFYGCTSFPKCRYTENV